MILSDEFLNNFGIISFPKVDAAKNEYESTVDIIVDRRAKANNPSKPTGSTSIANAGNDATGSVRFGKMALAYKPVAVVKKSKNIQQIIEIKIPLRAVFSFLAA